MSYHESKPFQFKQFAVAQSRSSMKVGTDAVLLGCWAEVKAAHRLLDVGTGNGVIALICAQRNPSVSIRGIDIDKGSVHDAEFNFSNSPWSERMETISGDFLGYSSDVKYDLIISNPPYFSDSIRASDPVRSKARHDDSLPADKFMNHAALLLNEDGIVSVIIPLNQLKRWMDAGRHAGLLPQRICHVFTLADREASRVMVEFGCSGGSEPQMESLLIERKPGEFSEAYKQLTRDFYTRW
ncbi:MAG: tRNA1(Val) (adenine(37)-N6)-methyltransferase [Flavobacteriales bacterium]|jgi:tRNA1Val (adenine37-N6)-methyltransferase